MQAALIQLNVSDTPARNLAGTVEMVRDAAECPRPHRLASIL